MRNRNDAYTSAIQFRRLAALDDLRFASGCQIQTFVALENEIVSALDRFYIEGTLETIPEDDSESVLIEAVPVERRDPGRPDRRRGRKKADQTSEEVYDEATEQTAVAHGQPRSLACGGRRGERHPSRADAGQSARAVSGRRHVPGHRLHLGGGRAAICARLKVLAGMDIAEHRLPQDGGSASRIGSRRLDFRASTFPTIHGEKLVLRVLDQGALRLELAALGMRAPLIDDFREMIRKPEGLILITGPTGSGKNVDAVRGAGRAGGIRQEHHDIENPVEYELPGTNQGQINEKAGFTFAKGVAGGPSPGFPTSSWSVRFETPRR